MTGDGSQESSAALRTELDRPAWPGISIIISPLIDRDLLLLAYGLAKEINGLIHAGVA